MGSGETHMSVPFPGGETEPWLGPGGLRETCLPHFLPCPCPQHCVESIRVEHEYLSLSPSPSTL